MTPEELSPYLYGFVVGTVLLGLVPLAARGHRRPAVRVLAMALVVSVSLVATLFVTSESFAVAHLVYAILTWSVPALGVSLILWALRKQHARARIALVVVGAVAVLPAFIGFYATNIEPERLAVNEFSVASDLPDAEPIRIGVAADIQSPNVGAYERGAVKELKDAQTDLVLYAGDLYSSEDGPFPESRGDFVGLVRTLAEGRTAIFVAGDHDSDGNLPSIVKEGGGVFLNNEVEVTTIRGARVGVLGLENNEKSEEANKAFEEFSVRGDIDYKIVLAHHPDAIFEAPAGVDLIVSGHTHGGQVKLPFVGPLITLSNVSREQAAGGLFDLDNGAKLFVTRGVGVEHWTAPKLRFGAPPEVNVLNVASRAQ